MAREDLVMTDEPAQRGYFILPATATPKQSSTDEDGDEVMTTDDDYYSSDAGDAAQAMEMMSIDISNIEDDTAMDRTDYDGDTEM
ncbi:hypothetical protein FPOAC2_07733 [Fusarium poae]|jgi:hypothetical protein